MRFSNERERRHVDALVASYTARTPGSKALAAKYHGALTDPMYGRGFDPDLKEIVYQIVAARAEGARVWDVDGNEYIDTMMGYGVNLFGHNPPLLREALEEQLRRSTMCGMDPDSVGEATALLCELTGMERAFWCNSGTESVLYAVRLARAATGRDKIVVFTNAYHGGWDAVLPPSVVPAMWTADTKQPIGITDSAVADTIVLTYGSDEALEVIRQRKDEIAAVLVEPVQTHDPTIQPREFLHELRRITADSGIALVFDEMVTGFRIALGGAQAFFGVRADIATYGKFLGAGMPIGVVAGTRKYMDYVDGGAWSYGDASKPTSPITFTAGTFCKHPLAMAGARAVLRHLKASGPSLQENLVAKGNAFVADLSKRLEPGMVKVDNCGSMVRFDLRSPFRMLLRYHLILRGVLLRAARGMPLLQFSTAHTDDDYRTLADALVATVDQMRADGLVPTPGVAR
jgi:glutamate-1-semialdehyde aminotransferase